eukprot:363022-Chlamydomonas_euryale.AAC.6
MTWYVQTGHKIERAAVFTNAITGQSCGPPCPSLQQSGLFLIPHVFIRAAACAGQGRGTVGFGRAPEQNHASVLLSASITPAAIKSAAGTLRGDAALPCSFEYARTKGLTCAAS